MKSLGLAVTAVYVFLLFTSCGSGGSNPPSPTPSPTPTASPTPTSFSVADVGGQYAIVVSDSSCLMVFNADGLGSLSNGALDCNLGEGSQTNAFQGTYVVSNDGRVELVLELRDYPEGPAVPPTGFVGALARDHAARLVGSSRFSFASLYPVAPGPEALASDYGFHFSGWTSFGQEVGVGRIHFDGNGHVTGRLDARCGPGIAEDQAIAGDYTLQSDGTGVITLEHPELPTCHEIPLQWHIRNVNSGRFVFVSADLEVGVTGEAEKVQAVAPASLDGSYVYSFRGSRPNPDGTYSGPVGAVGFFLASSPDPSIAAGTADENLLGWIHENSPILPSTYAVDANGRGTLSLQKDTTGPTTAVFYPISPKHAVFLATKQYTLPLAPWDLGMGVGTLDLQSSAPADVTGVKGKFTLYVAGMNAFDPNNPLGFNRPVTGVLEFDGAGNLAGTLGTPANGIPVTGTYAIDPNGRTVVLISGASVPIRLILSFVSQDGAVVLGADVSAYPGSYNTMPLAGELIRQ